MTKVNGIIDAERARLLADNLQEQIRNSIRPAIAEFIKRFPEYVDSEQWEAVETAVLATRGMPTWVAALELACVEVAVVAFEESGFGYTLEECLKVNEGDAEFAMRMFGEVNDASSALAEFIEGFGNTSGTLIRNIQGRSRAGNPIVSRHSKGDA